MKYILLISAIFISLVAFAQKFPFGTYYYLPKATNSESKEFKFREIKFTPTAIEDRYVDRNLGSLREGAMESRQIIDSIVKKGSFYYFVFKDGDKYRWLVFKTLVKGKNTIVQARANNFKTAYSWNEVFKEIPKDTLPFLSMTYFSKHQILHFSKLKPIDQITLEPFKKVLRKIAAEKEKEKQIYNSLSKEKRQNYYVGRFYDISFLYFFIEEGFAPFINGHDMEELKMKYKSDPEVKELIKATMK